MSAAPIRRHTVTLRQRQIAYRRAGRGPALIALHQAPYSSRDMVPLINRFSDRYTVIAPDTPGNGQSDPLDVPAATMADLADDLAALIDALGLERPLVYGFHTGALIALELAVRHPDRCRLVVANGFIELPDAAVADMLDGYLQPFTIDWTGSHLAWWWARFRDQWTFFPYHRQTAVTRTAFDTPSPAALQDAFTEFLRAGDGYRQSYGCAFAYRGRTALAAVRAPLVLMADRTDILYPYLDTIDTVPAQVSVRRADDPHHAMRLLAEALATHGGPDAPPPPAAVPLHRRLASDFAQTAAGSLHLRFCAHGGGRPVLLLHDQSSSGRALDRFARSWLGERPVIAPDLPGCGESEWATLPSLDEHVALLAAMLEERGIRDAAAIGWGTGATLALLLARRSGAITRVVAPRGIIGSDAPGLAAPAFAPERHGGHLLALWTWLRDRALFQPANDHRAEAARRGNEQEADAVIVHQALLDHLQAVDHAGAFAAAFGGVDLDAAIAALEEPVLIGTAPSRGAIPAVAGRRTAFFPLPRAPGPLADALRPFLDAPNPQALQ